MSLNQHPSLNQPLGHTGVPDLLPSNSGYNTASLSEWTEANILHHYYSLLLVVFVIKLNKTQHKNITCSSDVEGHDLSE